MLVFQGMGELVSHDHSLIRQGNPVSDVKFVGLRIVKASDLFGQKIDHERINIKSLGKQAKCFRTASRCIALGRLLVLIHFAYDVGANFFPRPKSFLNWRTQGQAGNLAHLREDFVGSRGEFGRCSGLVRIRSSDSWRFLRNGDAAGETKNEHRPDKRAQKN